MSENNKKLISFSTEELKLFVEQYAEREANQRSVSVSRVLEEYILAGIARNFPETKAYVSELYHNRYRKFADAFLLDETFLENHRQSIKISPAFTLDFQANCRVHGKFEYQDDSLLVLMVSCTGNVLQRVRAEKAVRDLLYNEKMNLTGIGDTYLEYQANEDKVSFTCEIILEDQCTTNQDVFCHNEIKYIDVALSDDEEAKAKQVMDNFCKEYFAHANCETVKAYTTMLKDKGYIPEKYQS